MSAAESPTQIDATKTSLQVWVFESVLRAFGNGSATYADVLARLRRLLATGTSPTELLKIVRRSQLTEPLPESAQGIVDILNDVIRRDAGETVESTEVQDADTQTVAPREKIMESREEIMEESVARQHAAPEVPTRSYEPTGEPEWAAAARTTAIIAANTTSLAADLAAAQVALTAEQRRTRDLRLELAEKHAVVEGSRSRVAEILRDYDRQKSETQILRDSLETRDTIIDQMQIALDDRDTRLAALQQEHAKVTPTLEAQVKTAARLEADLQAAIARTDAVSLELKAAQDAAAELNTQLKRSESHLNGALTELGVVKTQSSSYLELIRTREWCRGFDHNTIRELDAQVGAANAQYQALETERDRLQGRLTTADSERARLTAEVAARDRALLQARERATSDAQSIAESKEAADLRQVEKAAQIDQLRAEQAEHIERLQAGHAAQMEGLQAEHATRLKGLQAERAAQIERLQAEARERATSVAQSVAESRKAADLREVEQAAQIAQLHAEHAVQLKGLQAVHATQIEGLRAERAVQLERMQAEGQERATAAAQSAAEFRKAADLRQAELAAQISQLRAEHAAQLEGLQAEHATQIGGLQAERAVQLERMQAEADQREEEMRALMTQLEEARRPIEALESERDRLQTQLAAANNERAGLTAELAAQFAQMRVKHAAPIEGLQSERAAQLQRMQTEAHQREEEMRVLMTQLEEASRPVPVLESERDRLKIELAAADSERARLTAEVAARDQTLLQAQELATSAAQSVAESKEAADLWQAELATQIAELRAEHAAQMERLRAKQGAQMERLRAEADQREEEMGLLMAHLLEARRPVQALEADRKRLTEELAEKDGIAAVFDEQNRKLAAILEWTSDALEECETIMRRLGLSESNNAKVLGRIQASVIERLKSVSRVPAATAADPGAAASEAADRSAELVRIDGEQATTYVLAKRTRIGRATACELKIDSGSVSRHHALVIVGPRDTVIEDLNSTNGVLVNGRKVTRRVLVDGDALTIGDTRFRYFAPLHDRRAGPNPADCAAPRHVI